MSQGTKSINEYFKKMELAMIQANVEEDKETTMARFINSLNYDITHIMESRHYIELKEMIHMAVKVEKQLKRKGTILMHDGVTYRYSFEMGGRPITLLSLTPKKIHEEQLKLKNEKIVKKESLYVR